MASSGEPLPVDRPDQDAAKVLRGSSPMTSSNNWFAYLGGSVAVAALARIRCYAVVERGDAGWVNRCTTAITIQRLASYSLLRMMTVSR